MDRLESLEFKLEPSVEASVELSDTAACGSNGGVTVRHLKSLLARADLTWTTAQFVKRVVKPLTEGRECRYVDLPAVRGESGVVGKADAFASHCWQGSFADLVAAIAYVLDEDQRVWVDALAVNQHPHTPQHKSDVKRFAETAGPERPRPIRPASLVMHVLVAVGARVPCPRPLRGAPRVRRGDERRRRTRRQDQARASRRAQAVRLLARVVSRRARGGAGGEQAGGDAGWLAPAERRIRARPAHAGQHVSPRRHQRLGGDPAGGRRPHPRRDAPADPRAGGPRPGAAAVHTLRLSAVLTQLLRLTGGAGGQRAREGSPHRRAALHAPARDSARRARPHGAAARSLLRSAG